MDIAIVIESLRACVVLPCYRRVIFSGNLVFNIIDSYLFRGHVATTLLTCGFVLLEPYMKFGYHSVSNLTILVVFRDRSKNTFNISEFQ